MTRHDRNMALRHMLDKDSVIVFSDLKHQTCDGLPYFTIMMHDLKHLIDGPKPALDENRRVTRKAKVDMGIPKQKIKEQQNGKKYNVTMDPKNLKGNIDLQQHLNTVLHNKIKRQFDRSLSIQMQRQKKITAQDDYNIKLPDEEIRKIKKAKG